MDLGEWVVCKGEGVLTLLCISLGYTNSLRPTIMRMHAVVLGDLLWSLGEGDFVEMEGTVLLYFPFFLPTLVENRELEKKWVSAVCFSLQGPALL